MDNIAQTMKDLIEQDRELNLKLVGQDTMYNNTSKKPEQFDRFGSNFRWNPTTIASDSVWGGARVLAGNDPRVTFFPLAATPKDKEFASLVENIARFQYQAAGKRGKSNTTRQITHSSLLYDKICVQTTFLPYQIKNIESMGGTEKRIQGSMRFGQFGVQVRNAKNVHYVQSEWGLEVVVFEQVFSARDALSYWGNVVPADLKREINDGDVEWLYVVDYIDDTDRAIRAWPMASPNMVTKNFDNGIRFVEKQPHELPFIPWAIKGGGNTTETKPELHHRPMLDSVWNSGQFDSINIMRSLQISKAIQLHAGANTVSTTFDGESPEIDYDDPTQNINLRIGERVDALPVDQLDPSLFTLIQGLNDDVSASTISRILMGEIPDQAAFATVNLGQQSAARSIVPYQESAEEAISEVLSQFLLWAAHAKEDLSAWGTTKENKGERYTLPWNQIDPEHVMFDVELVADLPTDNMTKTNVGRMQLEAGVSHDVVFEQWGYTDPGHVIEVRAQEDLDRAEIDLYLQGQQMELEAMVQLKVQQAMQAQQMQMQQAVQEQQQQAAQPQEGLGGPGFNTAEGGTVPSTANTGLLRENVTGADRQGNPIE